MGWWVRVVLVGLVGCNDGPKQPGEQGEGGDVGGETGDEAGGGEGGEGGDDSDTGPSPPPDADSDGYDVTVDCDDADPAINPGAEERCDTLDNDCDGVVDPDASVDAPTWYGDTDGDGYGNGRRDQVSCAQPEGYVDNGDDCDDTTATTFPGAWDRCNGVDDDCDDAIDEAGMEGMSVLTVNSALGEVYAVDLSTAALTVVSDLASDLEIDSFAVDSAGQSYVNAAEETSLYGLDRCSGDLAAVGSTGAHSFCAMAFGYGDTLYAIDDTDDALLTLDPTTGETLGYLGLDLDIANCGLTYDCSNNRLILLEAAGSTLYELDVETGDLSTLATLSVKFFNAAVTFRPDDGTLLASTGKRLLRVDLSDGSSTSLGTFPSEVTVDNLELAPVCETGD